MRASRSVHPLLLEPTYWRGRLQELNSASSAVSVVPRPDLSGNGRDVVEFRLRAHDGTRLWGLLARSDWHKGSRPALIRVVGPCERPEVDNRTLEAGTTELILQEPAGRRLCDRVLDVLRITQMALTTPEIDCSQVTFSPSNNGHLHDEVLIAEQLLAGNFC